MAMYTLEEARRMLPRVRNITRGYYEQVEALKEQLENNEDPLTQSRLELRINAAVQGWARKIVSLGVEVKGLWVADWDSGDGYYWCWQLGEEDIEHFHRYETGFASRKPVANLYP